MRRDEAVKSRVVKSQEGRSVGCIGGGGGSKFLSVETLTTDDVVQTLFKHVDPDRLIVIAAGGGRTIPDGS